MALLGFEVVEEFRDADGKWHRNRVGRVYAVRSAAEALADHARAANARAGGRKSYRVAPIIAMDQIDHSIPYTGQQRTKE